MKVSLAIPLIILFASQLFAIIDPRELPTSEVFEQMKMILNGMVQKILVERTKAFPPSQFPNETLVQKLIQKEAANIVKCFTPNQEPIVNVFRKFPEVYSIIPNQQMKYHYENANLGKLADAIYWVFNYAYPILLPCTTNFTHDLLVELYRNTNTSCILNALIKKLREAAKINRILEGTVNNYQNAKFELSGKSLADLWFAFKPLQPPPKPKNSRVSYSNYNSPQDIVSINGKPIAHIHQVMYLYSEDYTLLKKINSTLMG